MKKKEKNKNIRIEKGGEKEERYDEKEDGGERRRMKINEKNNIL